MSNRHQPAAASLPWWQVRPALALAARDGNNQVNRRRTREWDMSASHHDGSRVLGGDFWFGVGRMLPVRQGVVATEVVHLRCTELVHLRHQGHGLQHKATNSSRYRMHVCELEVTTNHPTQYLIGFWQPPTALDLDPVVDVLLRRHYLSGRDPTHHH